MPSNIKLISTNIDEDDFKKTLVDSGFSFRTKSFYIMEAVLQYLHPDTIDRIFEAFKDAPRGSKLAFTYIRTSFIRGDDYYNQKMMFKMVSKENLWKSGFEPNEIEPFLLKYGWKLESELGYQDLYGRYIEPTGRKLGSMGIERLVYATKT